jgi:hypothetical protein
MNARPTHEDLMAQARAIVVQRRAPAVRRVRITGWKAYALLYVSSRTPGIQVSPPRVARTPTDVFSRLWENGELVGPAKDHRRDGR